MYKMYNVEMYILTQWIQVLTIKPNDLSLTPRIYMVEGENRFLRDAI